MQIEIQIEQAWQTSVYVIEETDVNGRRMRLNMCYKFRQHFT